MAALVTVHTRDGSLVRAVSKPSANPACDPYVVAGRAIRSLLQSYTLKVYGEANPATGECATMQTMSGDQWLMEALKRRLDLSEMTALPPLPPAPFPSMKERHAHDSARAELGLHPDDDM